MSDTELFLKKMKGMSIIKGELMKMGKDPDIIEQILMNEYDRGEKKGISFMLTELDLDKDEDIEKLMKVVKKSL